MAQSDYKLVAGWNGAGSLVIVRDVVPTYQNKKLVLQARGMFDEGLVRIGADKQAYTTGFQMFDWLIPVMGVLQYDYFRDTWTTGGTGFSGKVTVRTLKTEDTYANYNAVMHLPKLAGLTRKFDAFLDVRIHFIVEAAL